MSVADKLADQGIRRDFLRPDRCCMLQKVNHVFRDGIFWQILEFFQQEIPVGTYLVCHKCIDIISQSVFIWHNIFVFTVLDTVKHHERIPE